MGRASSNNTPWKGQKPGKGQKPALDELLGPAAAGLWERVPRTAGPRQTVELCPVMIRAPERRNYLDLAVADPHPTEEKSNEEQEMRNP